MKEKKKYNFIRKVDLRTSQIQPILSTQGEGDKIGIRALQG